MRLPSTFCLLLLVLIAVRVADAVTATAELYIPQYNKRILVAPGSFSSALSPSYSAAYYELVQPTGASTGCDASISKKFQGSSFYLIVSRGECSFEDKQQQAYELGAAGVIVYNSLEGIYQGRNYALPDAYECDNGSGYVSKIYEPVYGDKMNSKMPSSCTGDNNCASHTCVLTNSTNAEGERRVCCAWDLLITMGDDASNADSSDSDPAYKLIAAVFMGMADAKTLMDYNEMTSATTSLTVRLSARDKGLVYLSVCIIYLIAIGTVLIAAHIVAQKERKQPVRPLKTSISGVSLSEQGDIPATESENVSYSYGSNNLGAVTDTDRRDADLVREEEHMLSSYQSSNQLKMKDVMTTSTHKEGAFEFTALNAVAYVGFSSVFLIILYFFNITLFVELLYLMAAGYACGHLVFYPLLSHISWCIYTVRTGRTISEAYQYKQSSIDDGIDSRLDDAVGRQRAISNVQQQRLTDTRTGDIGTPSLLETMKQSLRIDSCSIFDSLSQLITILLSASCSLIVVCLWFFNQEASWVWLVQDFMGVCICIMCLSLLLLPNLRVASALLSLAFLYDIFFVFISPLIFSSSIMADVATNGGTEEMSSDENYCEKYPEDEDYCSVKLLPMMIVVPSILTYEEGDSILGLGDIVLPGLLAVWAARHDVRMHGRIDSDKLRVGYFPIAMLSYGVGLLLANIAVYVFYTGQPALLYIVPCMLGSILFRAYRTEELLKLWEELPEMRSIALPVEEEESLLGRSRAVEAEANWRSIKRPDIVGEENVVILESEYAVAADRGTSVRSIAGSEEKSHDLLL